MLILWRNAFDGLIDGLIENRDVIQEEAAQVLRGIEVVKTKRERKLVDRILELSKGQTMGKTVTTFY